MISGGWATLHHLPDLGCAQCFARPSRSFQLGQTGDSKKSAVSSTNTPGELQSPSARESVAAAYYAILSLQLLSSWQGSNHKWDRRRQQGHWPQPRVGCSLWTWRNSWDFPSTLSVLLWGQILYWFQRASSTFHHGANSAVGGLHRGGPQERRSSMNSWLSTVARRAGECLLRQAAEV